MRRQKLQTSTPIEALFERLEEEEFFFRYIVSNEGDLDLILIVPPQSIALLRESLDILLFDCTFKTNRYHQPLLNIAGVTGSNTTIQAGIVMLSRETTEVYTWAL